MKKVAFITGASRGIGASTALYFAKCGYDVAINYLNSKDQAEKIVSQIKALGQNAIALCGDVSDFLCPRTKLLYDEITVEEEEVGVVSKLGEVCVYKENKEEVAGECNL